MSRLKITLAFAALMFASFGMAAEQPAPPQAEEIVGMRDAAPYSVCPPVFPQSRYVPVHVLLEQADAIQPLTAEGWMVTNRPVSECHGVARDAATRAFYDIEHPLRLRQFDSQMRLAKAELAIWDARMPDYQYFNKAGALVVDYAQARQARREVQERLRNLSYERMLYVRHHNREQYLAEQGIIPGR